MDRITTIESKITDTLNTIDGTTQSTGYKFYTNTGTIQVYDEVLSNARNTNTVGETLMGVNYQYEIQDSTGIEGLEWSTGQKALTNRFILGIKAKVHNVGDGTKHPKNEIRVAMNECLSDLLFAFSKNYHLSGQVESITFMNALRTYEDISNNRIQTGTLETLWSVTFQQDFNNPDNPACW
jgi:hypothetical protein